MRLLHPEFLLLLPLPLLFLWWSSLGRTAQRQSLGFSNLALLEWSEAAAPLRLSRRPELLVLLIWACLLLGLARPQMEAGQKPQIKEGLDIILCLDTSTSMKAEDILPNRFEVAKRVSKLFIQGRSDDRIGLVVYANIALTQVPLTSDHNTLIALLEHTYPGMTRRDGTAIGNALATSVNRLKDTPGDSKVIVLLTDGINNAGELEPTKAAQLAAQYGIRVHAIGMGSERDFGGLPMLDRGIDMESLRSIAHITGGRAFRATNARALEEVFEQIDQLETVQREEKPEMLYSELASIPAGAALILLLLYAARRTREREAGL